jgi:hypothetical protein
MEKRSRHPKASTMQRIFNIKYTTPGAIAGSAVWVCYYKFRPVPAIDDV